MITSLVELASADDTAAKAADVLSYFRKKKCLLSTCNTSHFKKELLSFTNTEGAEIHKSMTPLKTEK
jgi:hypothetical protein